MEMTELQGTEKQIKWATDIRAKQLEMLTKVQANHADDTDMAHAINRISRKIYASWWIDHRNDNSAKLLAQVDYQLPQVAATVAPTPPVSAIAMHDFDGIATYMREMNRLASL